MFEFLREAALYLWCFLKYLTLLKKFKYSNFENNYTQIAHANLNHNLFILLFYFFVFNLVKEAWLYWQKNLKTHKTAQSLMINSPTNAIDGDPIHSIFHLLLIHPSFINISFLSFFQYDTVHPSNYISAPVLSNDC